MLGPDKYASIKCNPLRTNNTTKPRLATGTILLCTLASMRCVHWWIEQPSSSIFPEFPYLAFIRDTLEDYIPIRFVRLSESKSWSVVCSCSMQERNIAPGMLSYNKLSWMGTYGHRSPKPTILIGTPYGAYKAICFPTPQNPN